MSETADNREDAIVVKHVSKYFEPSKGQRSIKQAVTGAFKSGDKHIAGGYWALKDVSFEIKKGDFFGIVGRNGSGKSTLLKMIAGIYSATKGEIHVDGKIVPFIELGVGFNMDLSGRDNVFLNGALLGFNRKEMTAMYNEIVAFAELEEHMDVKLKNFSSGMQVRLAFSIAIRAKSDILLIDEVLAVGDAAFQQKCFNYFEDLKREHKTVVFVTHGMDSVRRFCNKAVYIDNGKLTHVGTPAEIADVYLEENLESAQNLRHQKSDETPRISEEHTLTVKLSGQQKGIIAAHFTYKSVSEDDLFLGISVIKDGISVAEMNTADAKPLRISGQATYYLDTDMLNSGMYYIGAGLFKLKNSELLGFTKEKVQFIVKGDDRTRGAALKLKDTWEFK